MRTIRIFEGNKLFIACGLAALAFLAAASIGFCETKYWKADFQYYKFTEATNWIPEGVPGPSDTAAFTNTISAAWSMRWLYDTINSDALFSSTNAFYRSLDMGAGGAPLYKWTVTNQFSVAPDEGDNDMVYVPLYANLIITNTAGTALMTVNHNGLVRIQSGGTCTVDSVVSTNGSSAQGVIGGAGSVLNILHGSHVAAPGYHVMLAGMNITGGTNLIEPMAAGGEWMIAGGNLLVDGPSTLVTNTKAMSIGRGTSDGRFVVTNGGYLYTAGYLNIGQYSGHRNKLIVTGSNSVLTTGAGALNIGNGSAGYSGSSNMVIVADGGTVNIGGTYSVYVGTGAAGATSVNNQVLVTGAGSLLSCYAFYLGSNASARGTGTARIENGGTLEMGYGIISGIDGTGAITNDGGVYQFKNHSIAITPGTPGNIILTNGTIAFRGTIYASVKSPFLTNIAFYGDNAYRLNNATSRTDVYHGDYVFDTGLGATNYYRLELVNGGTRYGSAYPSSDALTIGTGGVMLVSNTVANVDLVFTNRGALSIVNSTLAFTNKPANIQGTLVIDMAHLATTNGVIAATNLTLGPSSTLVLTGSCSHPVVTLCTYSGARSGNFGSVTGLPFKYQIEYGPANDGYIRLRMIQGSIYKMY